ncbi:hypothetical protein [Agromyces bauzanensis]|uniref:hypothetical protein n=1 Tax=Agromyces bauzanensis TaxID=1308924 RepID=UPI0016696999|nr:hypothetical protein [Agromyces bauzanensis]
MIANSRTAARRHGRVGVAQRSIAAAGRAATGGAATVVGAAEAAEATGTVPAPVGTSSGGTHAPTPSGVHGRAAARLTRTG